MDKPIVSVKNLVKSYGKTVAVDDISFQINSKEIFALVGPNGAGKSTTLRILATIMEPDSGEVRIYDQKLPDKAPEIRGMITYLPEEAGAYKNMSGLNYLKFMASIYSNSTEEKNNYLANGIKLAKLDDRIKDPIKAYSKGMTRKLLLARALMTEPKLAILDEPTSGLDVINSRFIRDTIREYADKGMAVLLSSHNMLEVEYLSDKVSIINKGKIVEDGEPKEILMRNESKNLEEVFLKLTEEMNG